MTWLAIANTPARSERAGTPVAIERTYYCDNPSCAEDHPGETSEPCHVRTATPPPYLPGGIIEVREGSPSDVSRHFCSWDCVLKYAASIPPSEIIPL